MTRAFFVLLLTLCFASPLGSAKAAAALTLHAGDRTVELSETDLAELETVEYSTSTDWTDGSRRFRGPLVRSVIEQLGLDPQAIATIHATAANDYTVEIPASDVLRYDVILATEMDGKRLTLRDKGPLWVVYPRDDHRELDDPEINSRWIWQLVELTFE